MPSSTLSAIQSKVRKLTRSPSQAQLPDADLNEYINTFVVYDFPEHLRMFNLRTTFTFFCNPYQDRYPTDTLSFGGVTTNLLYNFQNKYISVHDPVYIAGFQSLYSQSRGEFFGIYPIVNSIANIGVTGDGVTTQFTGVVNSQQALIPPNLVQQICLLQNQVTFDSVAVDNSGLSLADVPVLNTATGNPSTIGNLYDPNSAAYQAAKITPPTVAFSAPFLPGTGVINYVTGQYTINFSSAPGAGRTINSQTVPQAVSMPQALLYYDNTFIVRPVPDQPYRINFEAYIRPTELLDNNQSPNLEEWWQYIAYGASLKIFQDRMDIESVALIMPEYRKQENLCLRRTLVQYTNERTATIFTAQTSISSGWNGWGYGGGSNS